MEVIQTHRITRRKAALFGLLFSILPSAAFSRDGEPQRADTIKLGEVTVSAARTSGGMSISRLGSINVNPEGVLGGIRTLGESDIVNSLKALPGFSTSSDYGAGLSIDGGSYSQTAFELDGASIYFPYHFGGIFSTFNTAHMGNARVERRPPSLSSPFRLGGYVTVSSDNEPSQRFRGTANVGLLAASATVRVPVGKRNQLTLSGRKSYIDMLYGGLLKSEDVDMSYDFSDINVTWLSKFSDRLSLKINGFLNSDNLDYYDPGYALDTRLKWMNLLGSASLDYAGDCLDISETVSATYFRNILELGLTQLAVNVPSSVTQLVNKGDFKHHGSGIILGYRLEYNSFLPQYASAEGTIQAGGTSRRISSTFAALGARRQWRLFDVTRLEASLRASLCTASQATFFNLDPSVAWNAFIGCHTFGISLDMATQNVHQVGFSDMGMSSNFWIPVSRTLPPERSWGASLTYTTSLWNNRISPSITLYAKRVVHDAEYDGTVLDIISDDYDALDRSRSVNGYNAGGDVLVKYDLGKVTGWVSYGLNFSRRRGPQGYYPSPYETLNSVKAMLQWRLNRHLDLSAFFNFTTGRPYTPVTALYVVGGNVMSEYGKHNSSNLPDYHRLDLSMTYNFKPFRVGSRAVENFLNFSLLNAYGHKNVEMQYYVYNAEKLSFSLKRVGSLYRFLPSISYTVKF